MHPGLFAKMHVNKFTNELYKLAPITEVKAYRDKQVPQKFIKPNVNRAEKQLNQTSCLHFQSKQILFLNYKKK